MRRRSFIIAAVVTAALATAHAADLPKPSFVTPATLDLSTLLPPPPANDSTQTKTELAEVEQVQAEASPERVHQAVADYEETVYAVINGDLGPAFTPEKLPVATAFFARVLADGKLIVAPAKAVWGRPRPFLVDSKIKLCTGKEASASYPSGHATLSTIAAIILSDMLPEKRTAIFQSAARFQESRVVCGAHYPSDVEAGKIAGALVVQQMRANPEYQREFAAAKEEVRRVLNAGS
jgi:acid phosphatase (class A)